MSIVIRHRNETTLSEEQFQKANASTIDEVVERVRAWAESMKKESPVNDGAPIGSIKFEAYVHEFSAQDTPLIGFTVTEEKVDVV